MKRQVRERERRERRARRERWGARPPRAGCAGAGASPAPRLKPGTALRSRCLYTPAQKGDLHVLEERKNNMCFSSLTEWSGIWTALT